MIKFNIREKIVIGTEPNIDSVVEARVLLRDSLECFNKGDEIFLVKLHEGDFATGNFEETAFTVAHEIAHIPHGDSFSFYDQVRKICGPGVFTCHILISGFPSGSLLFKTGLYISAICFAYISYFLRQCEKQPKVRQSPC